MIIRKAKQKESKIISAFILLAMKDIIFRFIGENSYKKAIQFLNNLTGKKNNQYSYENCWVAELDNKIVAAAIVYDGARLKELRAPVATEIKRLFNKKFNPADETGTGEYYIDCAGVDADLQGKGIGSNLFRFLIDEYVYKKNETLGLLVEKDNPNAKKLYLKLGFRIVGEKTLADKQMEHLQFKR